MDIVITVLFSILTLVAGHYFKWEGLFGRPLGRIPSYVYGVSAIGIPLIVLYALHWRQFLPAIALAVTTVAAGITVCLCYWYDDWVEQRQRAREAEERERQLREMLDHEPTE